MARFYYEEDILKNWIGKWTMFVAVGHSAMAAIFFGGTYRQLVAGGLYNSVKSEKVGMAVWFALFGVVLFIMGMLIATLEKHGLPVSKSVGVALLLLTVLGVMLMPVSGFWLMFPAVLAILMKREPKRQSLSAA